MDLSNIDWAATSKLILAVLAVIAGVSWTINKNLNKTSSNVKGNNNNTNVAGRDINVGK